MPELISRAEAMRLGRPRYFTNKPCKRGHIAERLISGNCVTCFNLDRRQPATLETPRQEAKRLHLKRYRTGLPCPRGHLGEHQTSDGACVECKNRGKTQRREADPETTRKRELRAAESIAKREARREYNRVRSIRYRAEHPEICKERVKSSTQRKQDQYKARQDAWWQAHPEKRGTYNARRRAREKNPWWSDQRAIDNIFAARPPGATVDHMVPLGTDENPSLTAEGYSISGLNVAYNLKYMPPSPNFSKQNRMRLEDQRYCEDPANARPSGPAQEGITDSRR
jgi:hypothetical protein